MSTTNILEIQKYEARDVIARRHLNVLLNDICNETVEMVA